MLIHLLDQYIFADGDVRGIAGGGQYGRLGSISASVIQRAQKSFSSVIPVPLALLLAYVLQTQFYSVLNHSPLVTKLNYGAFESFMLPLRPTRVSSPCSWQHVVDVVRQNTELNSDGEQGLYYVIRHHRTLDVDCSPFRFLSVF